PPPSFMRLTISSDDPAGWRLSLHPVCCVNGSAHDLSAYPSHNTRFSCPSPAPILSSGFMPAVGGWAILLPVLLDVDPHAVSASATTAAMAPNFIAFLPPVVEHVRVIGDPRQPDWPPLESVGVAYGVHILTYRHELLPAVEAHQVAGAHADIDHLF